VRLTVKNIKNIVTLQDTKSPYKSAITISLKKLFLFVSFSTRLNLFNMLIWCSVNINIYYYSTMMDKFNTLLNFFVIMHFL